MAEGHLLMYGVMFGPKAKNRDLALAFEPRLQAMVRNGKLKEDQVSQALSEVAEMEYDVFFKKMLSLVAETPRDETYYGGWNDGRKDLFLSADEYMKLLIEAEKMSKEVKDEIIGFLLKIFSVPAFWPE